MTKNSITPGQDLIEQYKKTRPQIHISIDREYDELNVWDGDGPDPEEEGFTPYCIIVKAQQIVGGVLYEGTGFLGSSYYREDDPFPDEVHGYLPQMIEEAVEELNERLGIEK